MRVREVPHLFGSETTSTWVLLRRVRHGVRGYTLGCGPNGAAFACTPYAAAFPGATISNIFDAGQAHYNSLQIKAETKSAKYGIYGLIGYTYSRSYDTGLIDGLGSITGANYFPLPGWQNLDWGLSQINLNHNFTASIIYDLPFGKGRKWGNNWKGLANAIAGGWEATVIEKVTSGFPIFVVDSNNTAGTNLLNNNGQSYIRPNQVCNPGIELSDAGPSGLTLACFSPEAGERRTRKCESYASFSGPIWSKYGFLDHQALCSSRENADRFPN